MIIRSTKLQKRLGTAVKHIYSDYARELLRASIKDTLQPPCTIFTTTASNLSKQKGVVERRLYTVFIAVRAGLTRIQLPKRYWSYTAQDAVDKADYLPTRHTARTYPPNYT